MNEPNICLRPGCGQPAKTRGLCQKCYAIARDVVKRNQASWQFLEQRGRVLPAREFRAFSPSPARLWMLGVDKPTDETLISPLPTPIIDGTVNIAPPKVPSRRKTKAVEDEAQKELPSNSTIGPISNVKTGSVNPKAVATCADCGTALTGSFANTKSWGTLCVPCAQARARSQAPTRLE